MAEAATKLLFAPIIDPGAARQELEMPAGGTLADAVNLALPGHTEVDRAQLRVTLISEAGAALIDPRYWGQVRPRPGVRVVIRLVPGSDGFRSVMLAVVTIAAIALAPCIAPMIGVTSQLGVSLVAMGLNMVGAALINSLIPVEPATERDATRNRYTLSGWQNSIRRDEPVPYPLGHHRYGPPFAATSYSQITGDEQDVVALFCFGYGPLDISDIRIGDTPISEFRNVEYELREGRPGDYPVTLYPRQVIEDPEQVELVRPQPRDDAGEIIGEEGVETPVVRMTAGGAESVSLVFFFPSGLIRYSREYDERQMGVSVRIRQRLNDGDAWQEVTTIDFLAKRADPFFRQHTWELPSRGRWQIEVTKISNDSTNSRYINKVMLAGVQSIRPEYPINSDKPLALLAMRVRATYQLNGQLDAVNALVKRYALDWDGDAWAEGLPRNPASAYVAALTGPANPYPVTSAEIDWDQVQEWHEYCSLKGLKYDRIHESAESLGDMLRAICAAGRASYRHDGLKWGVVVDRPRELAVDHLNPRNSYDFRWSRQYIDPPHGLRISFNDETNSYELAERVVPWVGHSGDITLTEELALPGKTDPVEIWTEARRRMYEIEHRPDTFTCMQDGAARVATRGDLVMVSHYVLDQTQIAARVIDVDDATVFVDEELEVEIGEQYGLRFRVFEDAQDVIGASAVVAVEVVEVEGEIGLLIGGSTERPEVGSLVHFGTLGTESLAARVLDVEPGENLSVQMRLAAEATVIDDLTDAEVPSEWDGIVGEVISFSAGVPLIPRFVFIDSSVYGSSFYSGSSSDLAVTVRLTPGSGETSYIAQYRLQHRLLGAGSWTSVLAPQASGGFEVAGYVDGETIQLRAVAIARDGTEGSYTSIIEHLVGSGAEALPTSLDASAITAVGGLGHARLTLGIPPGGTTEVQLYRVPAGGTLDVQAHAVGAPIPVISGVSVTVIDGDETRVTQLVNGEFSIDSDWTKGTGWTISTGVAGHAAGVASSLSQGISIAAGKTARVAFAVSGRTQGSVTPRLTGGSTVSGDAINSNGWHAAELLAVSGNNTVAFAASADFDGAIDEITFYVLTAACAPQGSWDYYFKPLNSDGQEAAVSGPVAAVIS
ncbi:phage tail protein [Alloyangia pacifica]|uniref:Phage tail protein n=1 Tax=Alloyangia pacifica TaxID=311180 RepID=A0A2U8HBG2_9RHOB|nr:phage tail protein [Alloyangia pacifica]AWI83073.1 phage tail protein [Alloyangia pacifica]